MNGKKEKRKVKTCLWVHSLKEKKIRLSKHDLKKKTKEKRTVALSSCV